MNIYAPPVLARGGEYTRLVNLVARNVEKLQALELSSQPLGQGLAAAEGPQESRLYTGSLPPLKGQAAGKRDSRRRRFQR